jgi:hypothetical protein
MAPAKRKKGVVRCPPRTAALRSYRRLSTVLHSEGILPVSRSACLYVCASACLSVCHCGPVDLLWYSAKLTSDWTAMP